MKHILFIIFLPIMMTLLAGTLSAQNDTSIELPHDMLAYVNAEGELMLYDPQTQTETLLLSNISDFAISPDLKIAYRPRGDSTIYQYDLSTRETEHIATSDRSPIVRMWSPDGRYLIYEREQNSLYIWDSEENTSIIPDIPTDAHFFSSSARWSRDGQLAFVARLQLEDGISMRHDEIYVWDDGRTTNLSQNPTYDDYIVGWSQNGELLFRSERDGIATFFVWDGVSFLNELPDISSFIPVASFPDSLRAMWTDTGHIALDLSRTSIDDPGQIIIWDLHSQSVIRTYTVPSPNILILNAQNELFLLSVELRGDWPEILTVRNDEGNILFSENAERWGWGWSVDNQLAYCSMGNLFVWDGQDIHFVSSLGGYLKPQWILSGTYLSCIP